jgi:uncharacterized protein DUF4105
MRAIRFLAWSLVWLIVFFCVLWAFGALCYDFPIHGVGQWVAILFVVASLAALIFIRGRGKKLAAVFLAFGIVLCWWRTLKPTNDRLWQPDVAETAWAEIDGDEVTVHNVRNCDYRTERDYDVHWETRILHLSQLNGMDLSIDYWGSPWMAHPVVSFRFPDALPLCFSIETRKAIGQTYSAVGGLYRQYTLIYIVADERDSIRVRTNYRPGEDVYLYRTLASPAQARARFLEYIDTINTLRDHPRWYNAMTTNCTTSIRTQRPTNARTPWDWRLLINGKADELLYERHVIATGGLGFTELKQRSHINELARAADQAADFSRLIRVAVPRTD